MDIETGEITVLLAKWRNGESSVFEELMPLVYPHLRQVAAAYIRRERNPDLLQATALVHELYFKLLDQKKVAYEDRQHFYVFSANVMRRILIDHARGNQAEMRGGGIVHVPLSEELSWVDVGSPELLDLDRVLDELGAIDPHKVQLVELRVLPRLYLGGNGGAPWILQSHRRPGDEVHQELAVSPPASGSGRKT